MITGTQTRLTSASATALRTTSGPIPAGSPIVMPTRGRARANSAESCSRVSIKQIRRRPLNDPRAEPLDLRFSGLRQVVFKARHLRRAFDGFVNIFDVALEDEQIGRRSAIDF